MRVADLNDVAGLQFVVPRDFLAAHERAVAAFQVAEHPLALREKHFGMIATAALVFDDHRVRGARPMVADSPGTSRMTSAHFEPSRMIR